jgi:hypothetical protein
VDGDIEVARGLDAADDLLDAPAVPLLGGADEVVVGEAQPAAQAAVPSLRAARSMFWPCSSVPVRK